MITRDASVLIVREYHCTGNYDTLTDAWDALSQYIFNEPHFRLVYNHICLGLDTFKTILQARALYADGREEVLLKSVAKVYPVDSILTEDWIKEEQVQISGIPDYFLDCVYSIFPKTKFRHVYHSFHNYVVGNLFLSGCNLIVNLNYSSVQFYLYKDGQLQFVNQFDFSEVNDLIYYSCKIRNHYLTSEDKVSLYIAGRAKVDVTLVAKELGKVFEKVEKLYKPESDELAIRNNYIDLYSLRQ